jgi:hypothetical protein
MDSEETYYTGLIFLGAQFCSSWVTKAEVSMVSNQLKDFVRHKEDLLTICELLNKICDRKIKIKDHFK